MVVIFGALNDFVEGAVNRDPWHVQHVVRFQKSGEVLSKSCVLMRFGILMYLEALEL